VAFSTLNYAEKILQKVFRISSDATDFESVGCSNLAAGEACCAWSDEKRVAFPVDKWRSYGALV